MRNLCCLLFLLAFCWPTRVAAEEPRRGVAVIVGIGDYVFLPDVRGVQTTVRDWEAFFESQQIEVRSVLLDTAASREAIEQAAADAVAETAQEDELWFVYVGHGAPSFERRSGLLVGMDAQQTVRSLEARSISQSELLQTLESGEQRATRMVIDACFSGQTANGDVLVPGSQPVVPLTESHPGRSSTVILTASAANETSGPLPGQRKPGFSTALLDGLRGAADRSGDDVVDSSEARQHAERALRAVRGRTQTPQLIGDRDAPLSEITHVVERPAVMGEPVPNVASPPALLPQTGLTTRDSKPDGFPTAPTLVGYGVSAMYGGLAYYIGRGVARRNAQHDADRAAGIPVSDDDYEPQAASYLMGGASALFFALTTVGIATYMGRKHAERKQSVGFFAGDGTAGVSWSVRF